LFFFFHKESITQKESLGEYGSGWRWDYNTYAHVFDQTNMEGVPYRLSNNGSSFDDNKDFCVNGTELTDGQTLFSDSKYQHQISCRANTQNIGNYYSWSTSVAGGLSLIKDHNESNSVCPKNWQLIVNSGSSIKSLTYLFRKIYNISETNYDTKIRLQPLMFIRSGTYNNEQINGRARWGAYWTLTSNGNNAYSLYHDGGYLMPQNPGMYYGIQNNYGLSLRCVVVVLNIPNFKVL